MAHAYVLTLTLPHASHASTARLYGTRPVAIRFAAALIRGYARKHGVAAEAVDWEVVREARG